MPKQMTFGSDDVKAEATGFSVYEGPEPTPGVYNGVLKNLSIKHGKTSGNPYFDFLVEFADNEDTADQKKEKYNGYPLFSMVVPGDSELQQIRVAQLMSVLSGKTKASVTLDDEDDKGRAKVLKVGGKTVSAEVPVKVSIQRERDNRDDSGTGFRMRLQDLFPRAASTSKVEKVAEVNPQGEVAPVEDEVDTPDLDELREELEGLSLVALKKRAKEVYEFTAEDLKGKKADAIVDEIIALYDTEEAEEEAETEEEDESLDEARDARQEELSAMKLPALKKIAKEHGATLADLKGKSDSDVITLILDAEFSGDAADEADGDEGDEAAEKDEDGLWLYDAAFGKDRSWLIEQLVEAGYDADDFDDEDEYDQETLVDTLVDEGVVGPKSETAF